jgi:phosphatidylserine decarboxylase
MTVARWGLPTLAWTAAILAWGVWLIPAGPLRWSAAAIAAAAWLFILAFFRNPRREPLGDARSLLAPADGVVVDIEQVDEEDFIGAPALRIGIFLSVLDVHVNRSPIAGAVVYAAYRPGRFLDARHPDVQHANEANSLGIIADPGVVAHLPILVRQLSGLIARRIVCTHGVGDHLARGELYGMIRFGSRTEVYIPASHPAILRVQVGDRVQGGRSILADLDPAPYQAPGAGPVGSATALLPVVGAEA